jgi:hypothetical protein
MVAHGNLRGVLRQKFGKKLICFIVILIKYIKVMFNFVKMTIQLNIIRLEHYIQ